MATNINTESVFSVGMSQVAGVNKVVPPQKVGNLPERGKELPETKSETKAKKESDQEEIKQAVRELNDKAQLVSRELQFSIDKESGSTVIKVVDSRTDEVIRQIPGEEALKVARRLSEGATLEIFSSYT